MCGIAAILAPAHGLGPRRERMDRALDALASRGPDGRGSWRSADGRCALGHTRLAIRGGASGAQPLTSEDGAVVAVVNGELYGAAELAAELRAKGHRLATASDSELVVHLYEEHGEALLERLRGEFALLVWDARRQRLLAARDPFGIKPLVFARAGDDWLIASRAAALFAAGLSPALDERSLAVASRWQYLPPGRTLFAGVAALPPGHFATFGAGEVRVTRWHRRVLRPRRDTEAEAARHELRERLARAVVERAEAEVPVAFALSGGIDSAAVLGLAARALGGRPHAFTVSFPGSAEDELERARATAARLDAELTVVAATPERLAAAWPAAACAGEGLAVNAHLPAKWLLAQAQAAAGFRVVLGGEGADEVLYGYPHLCADAGADVAALAGQHAASLGLMLPDGDRGAGALAGVARRLGFVPTFLRAKAGIGAELTPLWRPAFAARHTADDAAAWLLEGTRLDARAPVDVAAALWSELALEGYILRTLGDGMEMAHGLEGRLPFLDAALCRWLETVPSELALGAGGAQRACGKQLLRGAMRGLLPDAVCDRPKHPFVAPPCSGPLLELCADAVSGARFAAQAVFSPERARAIVDRARAGDAATRKRLDPALWIVGTLALLLEGVGA
jgi:asparagine synthase (glutamine-hydrolysing)